jgi:hypothetical protein
VIVMTVSATVVFESVTVIVATRCGPVFGATENAIAPSPEPDAPAVIVRNEALLTPPHVQVADVRIEIVAEPPEAGNDVVVLPVITWQPTTPPDPFEPLVPLGDEGLPQPVAARRIAVMYRNRFINASAGIWSKKRSVYHEAQRIGFTTSCSFMPG